MTSSPVKKIRDGSFDEDIKFFDKLIHDIQDQDKDIDIPNTSELFTDKKYLDNDPDGNVAINGNWVHPIYAKIVNMVNSGLSPIICIVGKEGLGKSMTALRMAYELSDNINLTRPLDIENQLVYQPLEFLFLERESTRTVQIFEEANETLNPSDYHSIMNKAVAGSIRTQRKRQNIKIFVAPELQKIDPRIRDKADIVIGMTKERFAEITTYTKRHDKKDSRGLDYYYNNGYPDWRIPKVPEDLKKVYDEIDNSYKGEYLDQLIIEVLLERKEKLEDKTTAEI